VKRRFPSSRLICAIALGAVALPATAQDDAGGGEQAGDHAHEPDDEGEAIIVEGTRLGRRLQDEPLRVEVIAGEEIEEKALMRPGAIAMLVSEIGGVRVQVTSPALGAANVRMQGLEGRYTQLLADGLPLYGGQVGGLGLLQVPPSDLAQVEVIKGSASALYGGSALGGVINLVSKRPGDGFEADILANATTRNGQDLTAYLAGPLSSSTGLSFTGGLHRQTGQDIDGDGWRDMAAFERVTARPRFTWEGDDGSRLYVTTGFMREDRAGGTLPGRTAPDGAPFVQAQDSERWDAGLVGSKPLGGDLRLALRASIMRQDNLRRFGATAESNRHTSRFLEATLAGDQGGTAWVVGGAFQSDALRARTFPAFDYSFDVPGLFAQIEHSAGAEVTLSGSIRADFHDAYGSQVSPRVAALWRPGAWTIRASAGRGYFAPTPFVDAIEAAGLSRLEPLSGLKAETARNASLDFGWRGGPWEANVTLFGSDIDKATRIQPIAADRVRLVNIDGTTRLRGSEMLLRFRQNGFTVTGSYVFVDSSEPAGAGRQAIPLTPRHTAGLVGMWEEHGKGRIGIEAYYTGRQRLEDNPYRTRSRPYLLLGVLGELVLGRISLFANAENLLDVRQTRYDPLLLPARAPSGEWTTDAWAPLEGFTLNGGVRLRFGAD
jgi:iron complex outermembrane receptor protein